MKYKARVGNVQDFPVSYPIRTDRIFVLPIRELPEELKNYRTTRQLRENIKITRQIYGTIRELPEDSKTENRKTTRKFFNNPTRPKKLPDNSTNYDNYSKT